jgi:hypothetical protein
VEKFSLEIETYYTPDGGHLENVFNLPVSNKVPVNEKAAILKTLSVM